jgi:hypothetical protein
MSAGEIEGCFERKTPRCGKFTKRVLFLHIIPAYRTLATQKKLAYVGFQYLDRPPYSPYLAPSDYHMFPGLKSNFSSETVVITAVETWLDGQLP